MAKTEAYIPQRDDVVYMGTGFNRYLVIGVNTKKQTADVTTIGGVPMKHNDVPWAELHHLDESQNALRIVREATEK